jgi:hypothetical protein
VRSSAVLGATIVLGLAVASCSSSPAARTLAPTPVKSAPADVPANPLPSTAANAATNAADACRWEAAMERFLIRVPRTDIRNTGATEMKNAMEFAVSATRGNPAYDHLANSMENQWIYGVDAPWDEPEAVLTSFQVSAAETACSGLSESA